MTTEDTYRSSIRDNLNRTLDSAFIPEFGAPKHGKVRDIYFVGGKVVMVASDRVSAFDHVLSRRIPFKGAVLNAFNQWAMENTTDIIRNATLANPDPNVIVQERMENVGFEFVVRGHVWGSLAADYEGGKRIKSGILLPEGLLRYQPLPEPLFTPTTKAEKGHDEDVTLDDIVRVHGSERAHKMRDASVALFRRGQELALRGGMVLIDTKFELGFDDAMGGLYLIDECLTPDSSRYVRDTEHAAKFASIQELMQTGTWKDVSALLKERPDLKITEASKQFVRDVLIQGGYKDGQPLPELTDDQVVETAWRYIQTYEQLTGRTFDFGRSDLPTVGKRIMNNLVKAGLAYGGCVVPIGASENDNGHWEKLEKGLKDAGIPYTKPFFASAHRETDKVLAFVREMDRTSLEPLVYLTFAGRSNGLGPVVAGNTTNPVITCPVFSDVTSYSVDIHSSLRMPSKLPLMTVIDPSNAALAVKRILDLARN